MRDPMQTVAAAYAAVTQQQFGDVEALVAPEIDWRGAPGEDGSVPRCAGRSEAVAWMRQGALARGRIGVRRFETHGNLVLAHVDVEREDEGPVERFTVVEVHDGVITAMRGFATEPAARAALDAGSLSPPGA